MKKIELSDKEIVSCNTTEIYKRYGLDIYQYRELRFYQKDLLLISKTKNIT